MFTGPVGPVEVFFYWPEAVLGNFYCPAAIGSPLPSIHIKCMILNIFSHIFVKIYGQSKYINWKLPILITIYSVGKMTDGLNLSLGVYLKI